MKKKNYIFFLISFIVLIFTTSACTHHPAYVPIFPNRGADLYPQQQNKDGLIVAADDYFDAEKSYQTFGINFVEKNILVIEVIVSNRSKDIYTILSDEVFLVKDGRVIYPLMMSKIPSPKDRGAYFRFLGLQDLHLKPGESKHGFIYFHLPKEREKSQFSILWPQSDYRLRLAATKLSTSSDADENNNRLIYSIVLRTF